MAMMKNKGLIHIYTGNGKGKTTAGIGCLIRGYGAGFSCLFAQFLKGQDTSELNTLKKLGIDIIRTDEVKKFIPYMNDEEKKECVKSHILCYNRIKELILSGKYDLIVLDEIIPACELNLVDVNDLISLLKVRPFNTEIILTGRNAPQNLIDISDYVSVIEEIKHPYQKGIDARKGIEF